MALIDSSAERVHVLIRLADIALYLGDFSEAQRYGRSALDLASTSDASLRARCYGIVAATEYFGGDIQAAETRFGDALELLKEMPDAGMLTMAAPSGAGGIPAAVTDGGGAADVRRASSRRYARLPILGMDGAVGCRRNILRRSRRGDAVP
jgi:Tetratricopeptide repeat